MYNIGDPVYFDPVLYESCSSESGTCYKWYVLSNNGDNLDLIMNQNIIYVSSWGYMFDPVTVLSSLKSATSNWNNKLIRSDKFDFSSYKIDYTGYKARLPMYNDLLIASNNLIDNLPVWLYENLMNNSGDISEGYWLADVNVPNVISDLNNNLGLPFLEEMNEKKSNDYKIQNMAPSGTALYLSYNGKIYPTFVDANGMNIGIRPVITISKSVI